MQTRHPGKHRGERHFAQKQLGEGTPISPARFWQIDLEPDPVLDSAPLAGTMRLAMSPPIPIPGLYESNLGGWPPRDEKMKLMETPKVTTAPAGGRSALLIALCLTFSIWLCSFASPLGAQNLLQFEVSGAAQPGGTIVVGLTLDHEAPLRVWEVSVCHPGLERVDLGFGTGVAFQATFVDQEFVYLEETSAESFASSGTFSAPAFYLPATVGREIHHMEFTTTSSGLFGLSLCENNLGGVDWVNRISGPVIPGQPVFVEPDLQSAILEFYGPFVRGDCQVDGVLGLTDALHLLLGLFLGGDIGSCPDACDIDADGELAISDALALLNYLFTAGPPPQAPNECASPTTYPLGCVQGCP